MERIPKTYEEVLQQAYESWSPGQIAEKRREQVRLFLEETTEEYAKYFGITKEEVFQKMEAKRSYNAVNYYQRANFPRISDVSMMFETAAEAKEYFLKYKTICPACKAISNNPTVCTPITKKRGKKCDWKSYGFFSSPFIILCKDEFLEDFRIIRTFTPVHYHESMDENGQIHDGQA